MRLVLAFTILLFAVPAVAAGGCAAVDDAYARAGEALNTANQKGSDLNKPLDAYMKASDGFFKCHQRQWILATPLPKPAEAQTMKPETPRQ